MTQKMPDREFVRSVSRRDLLKYAGMGVAAVGASGLLAACNGDEAASGNGGVGAFPETPEWNFVFVNHVTTNPFFVPTQHGIEDASAIFNTQFQWTGSETSEISDMVSAFDSAIAADADGIAVSLVDLEAFNDPIRRALDQGIPVVSYNADAPNDRLSYIGQDLYQSGFAMGERIVELVGEGDVALFIATPGQLNIQPRIDGAVDAINESGAPINHESIASGPTLEEELDRVEAYFLGNPDVAGMFAVDAGSTQSVGQIVENNDAVGEVVTGGFDLLPETVRMVAEGVMAFTIDQQPYLQGFLPTAYLYLHKLSGGVVTPPETNTGLVFLDEESAQLFLDTESRFEGDSEEQKVVEPAA